VLIEQPNINSDMSKEGNKQIHTYKEITEEKQGNFCYLNNNKINSSTIASAIIGLAHGENTL
jgi:hypothetical protein